MDRTRANRDAWNAYASDYLAGWHEALASDVFWGPSLPPEEALRVLGGDVAGRDVLEVGCGGGQASVHLAALGARATAVDLSAQMLAHARRHARERGVDVRFVESSAEDLGAFGDASFDVVFSSFAYGFVENVHRAFREAARVLRPGGLFAFSWSSPIHMSTSLDERGRVYFDRAYWDPAPHSEEDEYGRVTSYHRTYGDWLRALVAAGLVVVDILEPEPVPKDAPWEQVFPYEKIRQVPGTTIWRAVKPRRLEL
jgi:SAM-dependent methyltransferase